jgi:molecular chaperone IbpA
MTAAELANLTRFAIGLEDLFMQSADTASFPPYDIIEAGDHYTLRLAVAGYPHERLTAELDGRHLVITGAPAVPPGKGPVPGVGRYVHKGIADRAFTRRFLVSDDLTIERIDLLAGILMVKFTRSFTKTKRKVLPIG